MSAAPQAQVAPLQGAKRYIATLAIACATLMVSIDMTIANVAIPTITGNLGVTAAQGTWIVTSYTAANAICMLLSGWLARRFGQVRLFVFSMALFTLTSALCGMATSLQLLIAARVVQGAAAGPMLTLAIALVVQCYPREKSSSAVAGQVMFSMLGPALGPIIGGWLTENYSWPWIFFINVPIGIVGSLACWQLLRDRESPRRADPVDYTGVILVVIWVTALQVMLEKGNELDWFESNTIVTLAIVAFVGFSFFMVWEWFEAHPVIDFSFFSRPAFPLSLLAGSLVQFLYFGAGMLTPLWLQVTAGYTASTAGVLVAPNGLGAIVCQPLVARMMRHIRPAVVVAIGCVVLALSSWMRTGFVMELNDSNVMVPQFLLGLSVSLTFVPLIMILLSGVPQHKLPDATALIYFARFLAGSFGTSVAVNYWQHRSSTHHADLVSQLSIYGRATVDNVRAMGDAGLDATQAMTLIERQADLQAQTIAANDYYLMATLLFLAIIPLVLFAAFSVRPPKAGAAAAAVVE